ncbi:D-galactarolactone cycloisomerase [Kribbella aluminosa]|uniref:D-galactarolactone cycloisomerase n=1 Tax=Kribbella aluminosa TaxID=416017 RepID=A0ABS4UJ37_9ACTN|nr:mandelate racemase/muconate lactonizing enzyme family protein [Kribbella aluminosa]MBP2351678.1 D-galactarolactone cycloisomerase [Kribbella aluminosa]
MTSPTVARVESFGLEARLPGAGYGTARVLVQHRIGTAVKVTTSDGVVGWGESFGPPRQVQPTLAAMAHELIGRPLHAREEFLLEPVNRAYHVASTGLAVAALSGLDIAVWDAWARTLDVPIAFLLGGQVTDSVPAYASTGYLTPERDLGALRETLDRHVEQGFGRVKLKIGTSPREDAARVEVAREAVGPDGSVIVDYNGNNTLGTLRRSYDAIAGYRPEWVEEPLPANDYAGWQQLRDLSITTSAGEALFTRFQFVQPIEQRWFDIVQPDVAKCGGFTEASAVRAMTVAANLAFSPHCWGSGIALAATVQLLASTTRSPFGLTGPDVALLEFDQGVNPLRDSVLREPIRAAGGRVPVPTGPGLGVEIDEDWIRAHAVTRTSTDQGMGAR